MRWTMRSDICDRCRDPRLHLPPTMPFASRRWCRWNCWEDHEMTKPGITVIDNGELYAPHPLGRQRVLIHAETIFAITPADSLEAVSALRKLDVEIDAIDATDCIVVPGFIDPHAH